MASSRFARPLRLARIAALDQPDAGLALTALLGVEAAGIVLDEFLVGRNLTSLQAASLRQFVAMHTVEAGGRTCAMSLRGWQAK